LANCRAQLAGAAAYRSVGPLFEAAPHAGEVIGIYLFRRDETRVNCAAPAKAPPNRTPQVAGPPAKLPAKNADPPAVQKPKSNDLRVGTRVKVRAAGDDYDGKIGTIQTQLDDDGDGLTIGVILKATNMYTPTLQRN
jgi:hypothetical protein